MTETCLEKEDCPPELHSALCVAGWAMCVCVCV